jgi:hypothetical protein
MYYGPEKPNEWMNGFKGWGMKQRRPHKQRERDSPILSTCQTNEINLDSKGIGKDQNFEAKQSSNGDI